MPSNVTTQAVEYPRNPALADVFKHLATLKTYSVDRAPKLTDLKRALRLSGMLMHEGASSVSVPTASNPGPAATSLACSAM